MPRFNGVIVVMLFAGMLGACASAEERCREGVETTNEQYSELHNLDNGRLKYDENVVDSGMHVNNAQTQLATRNFEGCLESLEEARRDLALARDKR